MTDLDLLVVGAGPGGYVAALRAAGLGLRTAVVERDAVGGRCLNVACMPAKAMLRSADAVTAALGFADLGVVIDPPRVDGDAVVAWRRQVVDRLTRGVAHLLAKHRVEVVPGEARIVGPHAVQIGEHVLEAGHVLLATGSVPRSLPGIPFGGRIVSTETIWTLPSLPASVVVVGAGSSGTEVASAYARLGARVTLLEASDRVLPAEEPEVSAAVARALTAQGIDVRVGTTLRSATTDGDSVVFDAGAGGARGAGGSGGEARAEWLVVATGRAPDTEALGLDDAGVKTDERGLVVVDEAMATTVDGILAIGDLVAGPALAHKASEEGIVAVEAAAGLPVEVIDHLAIPRTTFSSPTVASFGLTEAGAAAAGYDVAVGNAPYGSVGAGALTGPGFVKVVVDRSGGELLGGSAVGASSPELIQQLVDARALEGGHRDLARVVHGHPTLSEVVLEAVRAADGWMIHA